MGSGPNLLYLRTPWVGGLPPMLKNLSTEKTQFLHLAAKYKKSNLSERFYERTQLRNDINKTPFFNISG